ncbi:MAG: twin-arginine translocation signal domain-containing protein, partial [Chloroflexi bacterium]|nr:twin-arginine translocation signal domain-containing protein [Chloroflexota bacterium]
MMSRSARRHVRIVREASLDTRISRRTALTGAAATAVAIVMGACAQQTPSAS